MSSFTQGFNLGIMQGMSNMYAGLCNFWNFNMFGGFYGFNAGIFNFGFPRLYTYSSPLDFSPSLFVPQNYGGINTYMQPAQTGGLSAPSLNVTSVFSQTSASPSTGFDIFNNSTISNTYSNSNFYSVTPPPTQSVTKTSSKTKTTKTKQTKVKHDDIIKDMNYNTMLDFVLKSEGGYNPNDCGQASNKGVQQSTYDEYRKGKNLSTRDVKNITDEEVKDLYYRMYYLKSGADKITDKRLALYVFDTAVNMGVSAAKNLLSQCDNDASKFNELRIARYESIARNNPKKAQYLNGWKNRVAKSEKFADDKALA